MTDREYLWRRSNGIIILALAGVYWFGMGFGPYLGDGGWILSVGFSIIVYGTCGVIVWSAVRLRRKVRFNRSELMQGDERKQAESKKLKVDFRRIVILETVMIAIGVLLCFLLGYEELWAPWIALVVSLHFIPLGRIFRVRTLKVIGIVGSIFALVGFSPILGVARLMFLGGAMGTLFWLAAVYILWDANQIAIKSLNKQ